MIDGMEICAVPFEVKFAAGDAGANGHVEGYGAVFGNTDSHGDVIMPGAFARSIAERKAQGRALPMHVMHGVFGGDGVPAGVWSEMAEDTKGLHVKGKISGTNTDAGRLLYERVKDGALGGLSIGYSVPQGGSVKMTDPNGPKRQIKQANLFEVSLVDDPSNALARVTELKRRSGAEYKTTIQATAAIQAVGNALKIYQASLKGSDAPTADERQQLLTHLQDAYEALTGSRMPEGLKAAMGNPASKSDFDKALDQAMSDMMREMSSATMTGDPDHDFLAMMIPHHQGALAMAQAEIAHGKSAPAISLARSIVTAQTSQIASMHDMLKGKKSVPGMSEEMKSALAGLRAAIGVAPRPPGLIPSGLGSFSLR
ncbi:HK97 family phage prohead protease [Acetobacter indonesiensis]|uniref:HK97 family phage prohead protease n=1 Tax=Acetobacter indonesiensis TaxID=104101 RepID=UPI001F02C53D|nr:HK97 family phage prohead protease [Acetobacter indonesiensis]MCG0995295.1 HK97 family phage prohead protease [Acetobacter indonesiensis]